MGEMTKPRKARDVFPFEEVLEQYRNEILAYLWRMFSGSPEAEDSFQETFMRAFRAYPELDQNANVRAWLYRIATNVARTRLKRNHRRENREQEAARRTIPGGDPTHERVLDRLLWEQANAWIEALPVKQRAAFMLRKYQGCSYLEIGEALGCSSGAARANVYQALRKLKALAEDSKVEYQ